MTDYTYDGVEKIFGYTHLFNGFIMIIDVPKEQVLENISKLTVITIELIAAGVAAAILIAMFVGAMISRPITQITELVNRTASFDLAIINNYDKLVNSKDETGVMARAVIDMRKSLREMIGAMKNSAVQTADFTNTINTSFELASESINEVARAAEDMAQGASKQAQVSQTGSQELVSLAAEIESSVASTGAVEEVIRRFKL